MAYNLSFTRTANSTLDVFTGVNAASGGSYAALLLFVIYLGFAFLVVRRTQSVADAMLIPGVVVTLISIIFLVFNWIAINYFMIALILTLAGFLMKFF